MAKSLTFETRTRRPTPTVQPGQPEKPSWSPRAAPRKVGAEQLAKLNDEELLDLRPCDLDLGIKGTWLQESVNQVCAELTERNLRFRPHFWLSSEWFTPDGVPGVAIPFCLAHPRLMALEKTMMLEVEGGTTEWCLRILRHEVGHAIDNAFRLHRKKRWLQVFGKYSTPYPDYYQPKPYSKRFVLHLDYWYAQSHPAEDFSETFAVWLTPNSDWRKRYRGWPAGKKLEYVDELMARIADTKPPVRTRERTTSLNQLRSTIREHYEEKQARYGEEHPSFYDRDLRRLFATDRQHPAQERASTFLRRVGPKLRRLVAHWTGEYQYRINQVLREMIDRTRQLGLYVDRAEDEATLQAAVLLTVQTMNYLHGGKHRLAL